ncbi:hypothetical protein [Acidovorax radicis]|uniref:hypothetical protein n=1 Tax=Acidovorax radicis TaxID=758826 RepID=UPI001CF859DE|nr:hypothetical protein [Acidovorax radicis]UCU99128.1 hypothetical protein KI609_22170 [Acidovorax radicis]
MTPLNRPTVHDLLQRPALAVGVFMFSALTAVLLAALMALAAPADANARTRRSVEHNADGSTTAHTGVARSGANGAVLRGRTATTDGQGNASVTSRGVAVGAQGGMAVRQGSTTRNADGSASRTGTVSAQNAQGNLQSSGAATRNADGTVTQARSTTATSAAPGNSVQAQSSYSKDSGLSRSATCYDASGTAMACPTRP